MKNIAYRKAVRHSSAADYDHCGHLTTTGNKNYCWISGGGGEQWLIYYLGCEAQISLVRIAWAEKAEQFEIQTSMDGKQWLTAKRCAGQDGIQEIALDSAMGKYLRLLLLKPEKERYSVIETEIFSDSVHDSVEASPWKIARAEEIEADGARLSGEYDDSQWLGAVVPGTALMSWLKAGAVLDPDIADDQFQVSDSYFTTDYWYRWSFDAPETENPVWLNFDAINWKADVWLNGTLLGNIDGAFMRAKWDVTDLLCRAGERANHLAVLIHKNANPGDVKIHVRETSGPNGGVLGADNPTIHAAIGWDWVSTIRGRNVGIYGDVFLSETPGRLTIEDPYVKVRLSDDNRKAGLELCCELKNNSGAEVKAALRGRIEPCGISFDAGEETVAPGGVRRVSVHLEVSEPRLWWPNTYGEQFLHTAELTAFENGEESDSRELSFGIREFTYTRDWPLKIYCNGVRIVCRGGNWGMDDANLACTERDYDIKVRMHRDMNFTMIRNWVGMTNNEAFYQACDRYGILVWDDFWLANPCDGPDPEDEAMFMRNAEDKVRKNRFHASVALYCGRNEGMPPESLNSALERLCAEQDGTRVYIPHSALGLVSGFGPYNAEGPEYYFGHTYHTLHSERGMINIPSLESMKKMLTPEHEWPVDPVWALHDFCISSAQRSGAHEEQMRRCYGDYDSLEQFVKIAQLVDYANHKAMFEAVFAGKAQGMLMWMSNPAWPSMVWQTYDFWYDINGGYQGCKDACRPVNAIYDVLREEIVLVNATAKSRHLKLRMELFDLGGRLVREEEREFDVTGDFAEYVMEAPRWMNELSFLRLTVLEHGEEPVVNFYWTNGWEHTNYTALTGMKKAELSAKLSRRDGVYTAELENISDVPAIMVELRLKDVDTGERILPVFSDRNFISLMPGERAEVRLDAGERENAGLCLSGWNI